MNKTADELRTVVEAFAARHEEIDEKTASIVLSEDKWSLKEIIGHLVDSASNNHQRFVRLQIEKELLFPAYGLDWLKIQKYNEARFSDLLRFWKGYNILLAHIMRTADPATLGNVWKKDGQELSLRFLMTDYLAHLKGHLKHFEERLAEVSAG